MLTAEISSAASRLCGACGLCCNGVLFHRVILQSGDSASALSALGLKVKQRKEKRYFEQPCSAHQNGQCSIYTSRPTRCRLFVCRQLQRVASEEITEAMAMEKIQEAKQRVNHLETLLEKAGGENAQRPLSKRYESVTMVPLDVSSNEATKAFRRELAQSFEELDALLDAEFRVEDKTLSRDS